jgi:hypothetical protein
MLEFQPKRANAEAFTYTSGEFRAKSPMLKSKLKYCPARYETPQSPQKDNYGSVNASSSAGLPGPATAMTMYCLPPAM